MLLETKPTPLTRPQANSLYLRQDQNLADLDDVILARAALGLGSIAVLNSPLPIANGGSGQVTRQTAIDALTDVAAATDEWVLTKDGTSGFAVFKPAAGGSSLPQDDDIAVVFRTGFPTRTAHLDASALTAARVYGLPDATMTLAGQNFANVFAAAQTIQGPTATARPLTLKSTDDDATNRLLEAHTSWGAMQGYLTIAGKLGVGSSDDANVKALQVDQSFADTSGTTIVVNVVATQSPEEDSTVEFIGINFEPRFSGSSNFSNNIWAVSGFPSIKTTGNVSAATAFIARNTKENAGEVLTSIGFATRFDNFGGTNLTTYHFQANDYLNVFGTVDTQYGFYCADLLNAANNYAVRTNAGQVVFNESSHNDTDVRIEGATDANLFVSDGSADTVQVGAATASDSAKFYVDGKFSASGEVEINGNLNHDGTNIGLNGQAPVAQSTGWAMTNVTADKVFDANATTLDEVADVLGTLITYLISRGDIAA